MNINKLFNREVISFAFLFIVLFIIYCFFSAPGLFWEDSSQMDVVVRTLSISHTPGHPLYSIIGRFLYMIFSLLIVQDKSVVLTSVFLSSFSILVFSILIFNITKRLLNSILSGLLLSFIPAVFHYSTITETYSLLVLGLCSLILFLKKKNIILSYYIIGLFSGGSILLVLILPFIIFFHYLKEKSFKKLFLGIVLFSLGFSIYLFLPIRSYASPPLDWGNTKIFSNFINTITMTEFSGDFYSGFLSQKNFFYSIFKIFYNISTFLLFIGWIPIVASSIYLLKKQKINFFFLLVSFVFFLFFALKAGAGPDYQAYLIPLYYIIILLFSLMDFKFILNNSKWRKILYYLIFAVLIIFAFTRNNPGVARRSSMGAYNYQQKLLKTIPFSSVAVINNTNEYFLLLQAQLIQNKRNDIILIFPDLYSDKWYREHLYSLGISDISYQSITLFCKQQNRNFIYIPSDVWDYDQNLFQTYSSFYISSDLAYSNWNVERYIFDKEEYSKNHQRVIWENQMKYFFSSNELLLSLYVVDSLCENFKHWEYFYNKAILLSNIYDSIRDIDLLNSSIIYFDSSIIYGADKTDVNIYKAKIMIKMNNYNRAIEILKKLDYSKVSAKLLISAYYLNGQINESRNEFYKAKNIWPNDTEILNIGNIY